MTPIGKELPKSRSLTQKGCGPRATGHLFFFCKHQKDCGPQATSKPETKKKVKFLYGSSIRNLFKYGYWIFF